MGRKFNLGASYASYRIHHHGARDAKGRFEKAMSMEEYGNTYTKTYAVANESSRKNMPETIAGKRHLCTRPSKARG